MRLRMLIESGPGEVEAVTENISANGLLFVSDRLPAIDSRINFRMTLPSEAMGTNKDVTVQCTGRVVRHFLENGEKKAAAVMDEYSLKA